MKHVCPISAGLCLLLGACSGTITGSGSPVGTPPTGGAAGGMGPVGIPTGGTTGQGGAGAVAGMGDTGGQGGMAGAGGGNNRDGGNNNRDAGNNTNNRDAAGPRDLGPAADVRPPTNIDYSIWVLQLPIGNGTSPTQVSSASLSAGFSNTYFYPAADGGQIFMDPVTGITTPGSTHCRTELRETNPGGAGQAAWTSAGINTMTVSGKVIQAGTGAVTIGQLFIGTDSIPLVEMEYSAGRGGFQILYEEASNSGTTINLNTPIALNERYTYTLSLSNRVLTITVNGRVVYTRTPGAAALGKQFYFKAGNYDQSTSAGPISTTPRSVVEIYGVEVVHN
jgi:hypothetical protein